MYNTINTFLFNHQISKQSTEYYVQMHSLLVTLLLIVFGLKFKTQKASY